MRQGSFLLLGCVLALTGGRTVRAIEDKQAARFVGQDLQLRGTNLVHFQIATDGGQGMGTEHIMVFREGFSLRIGSNHFETESAVVLMEPVKTDFRGREHIFYLVRAYLEGEVGTASSGEALTSGVREAEPDGGMALMLRFSVMGEVFVSADQRETADPRGLRLYGRAIAVLGERFKEERPRRIRSGGARELLPSPGARVPKFRYPINIAAAGSLSPRIESTEASDGTNIATVMGRFYLWQKQDDSGSMLEMEADSAVIFYAQAEDLSVDAQGASDILASGLVEGIYLRSNVVMREGERSIRADEMFYDFQRQKALATNAVMRTYDEQRGVPVYVRAVRLRQIAENRFAGDDVVITTSEFYAPQVSLHATKVAITDMTRIDEDAPPGAPSLYNAQMQNARFKLGDLTLLTVNEVEGRLDRPEIPLRGASAGHSKTWGTSVETRWYLERLLGLKEQPGTDSTLSLDYFSKRGIGGGIESEYTKENYFGNMLGYVINDQGKDRLSRLRGRRNVEPPRELRGRFSWQHRQFLPYNWQFTGEVSYLSDEYFLEQFYRGEYGIGKEQETLAHMKRSEENWALSFLAKGRINDFYETLEEIPTGEFHWTGQSFWDDRLTLYNDTQVSRLRQRIGNEHLIAMDESSFTFVSHRTELDMPLDWNGVKIVPYAAQNFGMDSRAGFERTVVNGINSRAYGDERVWIAEGGIRVMPRPLWKVDTQAYSRLWDVDQIRHIIKPHSALVVYHESDTAVRQRDTVNVGASQIWQTKRGPEGEKRTVDWMRLDTDLVFVDHSDSSASLAGPDRFIWNRPMVPLRVLAAPQIFHGDLAPVENRFEMYGPRRDYFSADYVWRVGETTAILTDGYYDLQSGVVQQYNIGMTRLVWPELSYYVGSRYLRRTLILGEQGSNAFVAAITYVLDPRYTVVFSQQYDFDYGKSVRNELTLIRKYHRMYMGISVGVDSSMDSSSVMFSMWPEGVSEMALGSRRYTGISSPGGL